MRSMGFDTGFRDVRATNLISSSEKQNSPSKAMLRMQCEIEYMKQELEFIKKIILVDKVTCQPFLVQKKIGQVNLYILIYNQLAINNLKNREFFCYYTS